MNRTIVAEDAMVQEIRIKSPASRIFAALTVPRQLLEWWKIPGRFELVEASCDLRRGGRWRMQVRGGCGPESTDSTVSGVYRVIDPPRCLEFTWIREQEDHPETVVRWDLEESGDWTLVRVTHSGLTSEGLRRRNSGWPMILSLLGGYIARGPGI